MDRAAPGMQRIHGLSIRSDVPLPGLPDVAAQSPDVVLRFVDHLGAPPPDCMVRYQSPVEHDGSATVGVTEDRTGCTHFRYSDGTAVDITLDDTCATVEGSIAPHQTLEDFCVYLYGPILGLVLRRMGRLALHASAVLIEGRALLIAGPSGAGKSTTAASLAERGHTALSDDLTALAFRSSCVYAHAAFDHLRLWPESEALVLNRSGALQPITGGWEKLRYPLTTRPRDAAPIGACVFLVADDEAATPTARRLSPGDGLIALAANSYANHLLTPAQRAEELQQLASFAERVVLTTVIRPTGDGAIHSLCDLLITLATDRTAAVA